MTSFLTDLINDPNTAIKPADKGGAIVVQDTFQYQQEILSQLHKNLITSFLVTLRVSVYLRYCVFEITQKYKRDNSCFIHSS